MQKQVLAIGALIAAACVAVSGVIGFVGLMVPLLSGSGLARSTLG